MSAHYEPYCLADPIFYDSLAGPRADGAGFAVAEQELPAGWQRHEGEVWQSYRPPGRLLPSQGWKIHISACPHNAERVLTRSRAFCVRNEIAFKFLRGSQVLHMRNAKYAPRTPGGKLMTVYPVDLDEFQLVLDELGDELRGEPGPYLLNDLRWGNGPLYVRYGGFAERYCHSATGELVPAIEDPDGDLVPERTDAAFHPPGWVTVPETLAPAIAARTSSAIQDIPFRVTRVLHRSNGGGLYRATDPGTGTEIVLKEARPYAGLTVDGSDAMSRLRHEYRILHRLAGVEGTPRVRGYMAVREHEFLVLDHVDGTALHEMFRRRYPLTGPAADPEDLAAHTRWVLAVYAELARILDAVHAHGIVHGGLHMSNVLIRPDGRVVLLDFELASDAADGHEPTSADPGFETPLGVSGTDVDRYALACLGLGLFFPITEVIRLDVTKARQLTEAVASRFPVPRSFLDRILRSLGSEPRRRGRPPKRPVILGAHHDSWPPARASLAAGIVTSATPEREDRLFPGDIAQFHPGGGLNIAHGAAGVLYALAVTGCGRYASFEEWLVSRARRPDHGMGPGFHDGLHGIAYVLDHLGHPQEAMDLLDRCHRFGRRGLGIDLFGGLSGIGLNLLHFASRTGDNALFETAIDTAEMVADRLGAVAEVAATGTEAHQRAGLMRGSSGPALLFTRLYERTGDSSLLDLAAVALRQDLRWCAPHSDDSRRGAPADIDQGSAGIGLALAEYLVHREDEEFESAAREVHLAACSPLSVQSGLFSGRAGRLAYLSRPHPPGAAADIPEVRSHIRRLNWHALSYQGHLAFPGDRMLRLSMDLATGSAGVLLALGAAMHDEPVGIPLLEPPTVPAKTRHPPEEWTTRDAG